MATLRNLLPDFAWLRKFICMIIGTALLGLWKGLIVGTASVRVANHSEEEKFNTVYGVSANLPEIRS